MSQPSRRVEPAASTTIAAVVENEDLVALILARADLDPFSFVAVGRVSKAWHAATHANIALMLAAARKPDFLTKRTLMGLFGLSWQEADKLPRGMRARANGGWIYMYTSAAINQAMEIIGNEAEWRRRIADDRHRLKSPQPWKTSQRFYHMPSHQRLRLCTRTGVRNHAV